MTAEDLSATEEPHHVDVEKDAGDGMDEASANGQAGADDTEPFAMSVSSHEDHECQLMLADKSDVNSQSNALQPVSVMVDSQGQIEGNCIQLSDSVDVTEHRRVNECGAGADDSETSAAAATNADADLLDTVAAVADVANSGSVSVTVGEIVAGCNDDPPIAAVPDEPQQQPAAAAAAADAEVVEPVGNIIPPPLAVLAPQGLGDVHQAMMQGGGPVGFQPYKHPNLFALRVIISV